MSAAAPAGVAIAALPAVKTARARPMVRRRGDRSEVFRREAEGSMIVPGDADGGGWVCGRRTSDRGNKHGDNNNTSDAWNDLRASNREKGDNSAQKQNSHEDHHLCALSFVSAPRPIASDPFWKRFGGAGDTGQTRLLRLSCGQFGSATRIPSLARRACMGVGSSAKPTVHPSPQAQARDLFPSTHIPRLTPGAFIGRAYKP